MSVLRTERDFSDLTRAYLERAASQGVRHAEIFFDPQAHTGRGVDFAAVVSGISEGLRYGEEAPPHHLPAHHVLSPAPGRRGRRSHPGDGPSPS